MLVVSGSECVCDVFPYFAKVCDGSDPQTSGSILRRPILCLPDVMKCFCQCHSIRNSIVTIKEPSSTKYVLIRDYKYPAMYSEMSCSSTSLQCSPLVFHSSRLQTRPNPYRPNPLSRQQTQDCPPGTIGLSFAPRDCQQRIAAPRTGTDAHQPWTTYLRARKATKIRPYSKGRCTYCSGRTLHPSWCECRIDCLLIG